MTKQFEITLDIDGLIEITEKGKKRIVKPTDADYDFMTHVWALRASVTIMENWEHVKHSFVDMDANDLMEYLQISKKNVEDMASDLRNGIYS